VTSSSEDANPTQPGGKWREGVLGIIGGMGTLASAQFLRTIYEQNPCADEQDAPTCILHSDPAFPDRSEAILADSDPGISERLVRHLRHLRSAGATRFVLCCVTLHHFLPRVPEDLRQHVISLVDLMVEGIARAGEPHLVICTRGSRHAGVLERSPRWGEISDLAVFPGPDEQDAVHELLYRVKAKPVEPSDLRLLDELRCRYGVDALLGACTETHLLHVALRQQPGHMPYRIEDPLFRLAEGLEEFLHG
jgi:aspartate racemase